MKKDHKAAISEYLRTLNDEELTFLVTRLSDKLGGDVAEALNFMSKSPSMDTMFRNAQNSDEVFDLCDKVRDMIAKDHRKGGRSAA